MNQKATVEFDAQAKTLTIKGELLPGTALEHDMLCDLLFGNQPKRRMQVSMDLNVITYECVIETADPVIVPATITGLASGTDLDEIDADRIAAEATGPKLGTTEEAEAALIAGLASLTQTGTN